MLHEAARRYLDVPFRHQGRSERAMDCVGLLALAVRDCGWHDLLAHDIAGYGRNPHNGLLESGLAAAFGEPLAPEEAQPGDVVAVRYEREIRHVAIVGDHPEGLSLIHTDSRVGFVTEHHLSPRWLKRIAHVYRRAAP